MEGLTAQPPVDHGGCTGQEGVHHVLVRCCRRQREPRMKRASVDDHPAAPLERKLSAIVVQAGMQRHQRVDAPLNRKNRRSGRHWAEEARSARHASQP